MRSAERQDSGHRTHALHNKAQPRLHLRGGQCFCALAVKRERGVQVGGLRAKDVKGAVGLRMRQKKMQHECRVLHSITNVDCCLSVVRRNELEQPMV